MKVIYVASLLFLGAVIGRNIIDNANKVDDSDDEKFTLDDNVTAYLSDKCKQVGGEAAAKKLKVALESTVACLNNQLPKSKDELEKELTTDDINICSKRRKSLRGCFVELIEAAKDCSVEQEKYAPEFFFDALDSLLDFACHEDSKVLQDVIQSNNTYICIQKVIDLAINGTLQTVCTDNFKLMHANEDNIITKPELCDDLNSAKTCYSSFLTKQCPEAKELSTLVVGVFDAVSSPCKASKAKRHVI